MGSPLVRFVDPKPVTVPLSVIPAIILASILNSKLPGMKFFRSVYFVPSVAAVVGVALIWQWMYNATVGWINFGILQATNFFNGIFGNRPYIFSSAKITFGKF